jgi:Family of unknown function (DUF6011)
LTTTTMPAREASDARLRYITRLLADRQSPYGDDLDLHSLTMAEASTVIDTVLDQPRTGQERAHVGKPAAGPGVYRKDGKLYVVKATRETRKLPADQQRCYAMELVELPGSATRLTEAETEIPFELQIRKGFVYELADVDRMPLAGAEQLMVRYAKCIVCGHGLRKADSVRKGIGPVCAGYFRGSGDRDAGGRPRRAGLAGDSRVPC